MSADVHFSAQKQVKTKKKKVIMSAEVHFCAQKQIKTPISQKSHYVSRPLFALKLSKIFRGRMI